VDFGDFANGDGGREKYLLPWRMVMMMMMMAMRCMLCAKGGGGLTLSLTSGAY
jgi:hypothetical protein